MLLCYFMLFGKSWEISILNGADIIREVMSGFGEEMLGGDGKEYRGKE
jgi:hypothetical protein